MGRYFVTIIFLVILIVGFTVISFDPDLNFGLTGKTIVENLGSNEDGVKVFVLTGKNFKFMADNFENPKIRVNQGDKVRIEFSSIEGLHDWTLDEFNAKISKINEGGQTSVEFIADKTGVFEYYCSVGSHRSLGMKGVFVVE